MPYVMISTQVRLDVGPTFVGDEWSDEELMEYLNAQLIKQVGNNFAQYRTEAPPRVVLDKLEKLQYRVVAVTGVGQTCIWTLHQEMSDKQDAGKQGKEIQLLPVLHEGVSEKQDKSKENKEMQL